MTDYQPPPRHAGQRIRHSLLRYATTAAIVLAVGGLFVQREFLDDDDRASASFRVGPLDEATAEAGRVAPDFALENIDGEVVRLSDFRGQTVVLNFWATWCLPCWLEMPDFQELYEARLDEDNFTVIAVNMIAQDSTASVQGFVDDLGLTFPVVFDTGDLDVAQRYRVTGLPMTVFIDSDGVLRDRTFGLMVGEALAERVTNADRPLASDAR